MRPLLSITVLLFIAMFVALSNLAYSQTMVMASIQTAATIHAKSKYRKNENRIRWTWQLPHSVRKAFNETRFSDWYIEKMVRFNQAGKTFYRFSLNNENLLDGDHYDCFLEKTVVTISDAEVLTGTSNSQ